MSLFTQIRFPSDGDNQMIFFWGGGGGGGVEISYVYFKILGVGNFNKNFLGWIFLGIFLGIF